MIVGKSVNNLNAMSSVREMEAVTIFCFNYHGFTESFSSLSEAKFLPMSTVRCCPLHPCLPLCDLCFSKSLKIINTTTGPKPAFKMITL